MKVLITGACGMVGRQLVGVLQKAGHTLRLSDSSRPEDATVFVPGQAERQKVPVKFDAPFVQLSILHGPEMLKACQGMDAVIHLATLPSGLYELGQQIMEASVVGTYVVMDAAHRAGVKRVFYASSINAFGTIYWRVSGKPPVYPKMPLRETEFTPVPEDPYSLGKWVNELTAATFHRAFGGTYAGFRFAGVWGDAMYQDFKQHNMKPTTAWNDDLYQWVHIQDVVEGLAKALACPALPGCGVYTLGAGDTRCPEPTMEILQRFRPDLAATLERPLIGREPLMSIRTAQETFGYAPRFRLAD